MQISLWDLELYGSIIADLPALMGSELLNSWRPRGGPIDYLPWSKKHFTSYKLSPNLLRVNKGLIVKQKKQQHYIYIYLYVYIVENIPIFHAINSLKFLM